MIKTLGVRPAVSNFQADFRSCIESPGHAGLWWERYGGAFVTEGQKKKNSNTETTESYTVPRADWVRELATRVANAKEALAPHLASVHQRRAKLAQRDGIRFVATLSTPLVIGTGIAHPIGNGLMLHPTLGIPYIPGSALKGATQAFVHEWLLRGAYDTDEDLQTAKGELRRIFGQPHRIALPERSHPDGATGRGSVIFFDALPLDWPEIGTEIVNPHIGNYLTEGEPLRDGTAPLPVQFASVKPGCRFLFMLGPAPSTPLPAAESRSDVSLAAGWLAATATDLGIGAKTKSQYGRFKNVQDQPFS